MKIQYDFDKDWPKTKKALMELSNNVLQFTKKSEEKIVRLSKEGKLRVDIGTLSMQKEKLYYLIGKEYVHSGYSGEKSLAMIKLIAELEGIDKKRRSLKTKIKRKNHAGK